MKAWKFIGSLEIKKIHRVLEFSQLQWLKTYVELNTQKGTETEKNGNKDRNSLYKLMNNTAYGKTMENVRSRIEWTKRLFKMDIKTKLYVTKNTWQWCTSSIMITLETNMLTDQDYYSLILIVWSMKLKPKIFMKNLVKIKKCLILVVVGKMKDEKGGVAIEEFIKLKPKMSSVLVDDNMNIKKQRMWAKMLLQQ